MTTTGLFVLMFFQVFLLQDLVWGQSQNPSLKTGQDLSAEFAGRVPREWGQKVTGVKTRLKSRNTTMALTFDACGGGPRGRGYDVDLIRYLRQEAIPATLFLSGGWIDANRELVRKLSENPLFRIENHGLNHRPCSASGRSAYGIRGTRSVTEIAAEIEENARKIENLTGRRPVLYRPGTGYLDEVCVDVAKSLNHEVVNFGTVGDAGATYASAQVKEALLKSPVPSIVVMHMNRPESETAEGLKEAVPELRRRGVQFVALEPQGLE